MNKKGSVLKAHNKKVIESQGKRIDITSKSFSKGAKTINSSQPLSSFVLKPPTALSLETSLLNSCMVYPGVAETVSYLIKPMDFYDSRHQQIFSAIRFLARSAQPVMMESVDEELKRSNIYLPDGFLFELAAKGDAVEKNTDYHALILRQYAIMRRIMDFSLRYVEVDLCRDAYEVLANLKKDYYDMEKSCKMKTPPKPSYHLMNPDDKLSFGKYKGFSIAEVLSMEKGMEYIEWVDDYVDGIYMDWRAIYDWRAARKQIDQYNPIEDKIDLYSEAPFGKI